jgi:hypothetical protein
LGTSLVKLSASSQHQAEPTFVDSATLQHKVRDSPFHTSVVTTLLMKTKRKFCEGLRRLLRNQA